MALSVPGALKRPRRGPRNRRDRGANRPQPTAGIRILSAVKGTDDVTITFDQSVSLKGTPNYTLDGVAVLPTSATMTSPTTLVVTFGGPVGLATDINIPYEEPSVRNAGGGFVADSTFTLT